MTPPDAAAAPVASEPLPAFSFAFQPIVDTATRRIHSYEALIRGRKGEGAFSVLQRVPGALVHRFDFDSRLAAIALAGRLGLNTRLNLNFLPQALARSDAPLTETLRAAERCGIAPDQLVIEVTETEVIDDHNAFALRINRFRGLGLAVAIDDFGAGYSGLNLLADFQPDQIKIDMNLVRGIESHGARQAIVRALIQACTDLGIDIVAEGVETAAEYRWFADEGVHYFQGYLFGRPGFECLPQARFP